MWIIQINVSFVIQFGNPVSIPKKESLSLEEEMWDKGMFCKVNLLTGICFLVEKMVDIIPADNSVRRLDKKVRMKITLRNLWIWNNNSR